MPEVPEMPVAEKGIRVAIIVRVRAIAGISVIVIVRGIVTIVRNVTICSEVRTEPVGKLKFRAVLRYLKRVYEGRALS
jgi:hypothetical protein